jgi:hypothetical protein
LHTPTLLSQKLSVFFFCKREITAAQGSSEKSSACATDLDEKQQTIESPYLEKIEKRKSKQKLRLI